MVGYGDSNNGRLPGFAQGRLLFWASRKHFLGNIFGIFSRLLRQIKGYGDLVPETVFGKIFASISMLMGYGLLAVPTILGALEINQISKARNWKEEAEAERVGSASYYSEGSQEPLLGDDTWLLFSWKC